MKEKKKCDFCDFNRGMDVGTTQAGWSIAEISDTLNFTHSLESFINTKYLETLLNQWYF